jgi:hypothetical protein
MAGEGMERQPDDRGLVALPMPRSLPDAARGRLATLEQRRGEPAGGGVLAPERADDEGRMARRAIVCRLCRARITDAAERTAVDGHHEHTFFNPAGVTYRIACFARVPGCRGVGADSDEFTWFAGHRWQVAVCASCGEHLGWLFSGASSFAALISARVQET